MNNNDKTLDKFSTRFGYREGRCNAVCKSGKLCGRYPMPNGRCPRHGGRGNNGGWHSGNRRGLNGAPHFKKLTD